MTIQTTESQLLAERLTACLPAATFELETICRLTDVVATREVPTAAIECVERPRLLVNPDFVRRHCVRDEHLFLLVMHELWHVLLAHTRLYPRATPAQNIAFDAIINAGLARELPAPEYRGFFEAINPADRFPGLLLRPPLGWPHAPVYSDVGPRGTAALLRRLYPADPTWPLPLYSEILKLLEQPSAADRALGPTTLLGDHGDESAEAQALDDELLGDIVRQIVGRWPPPPFPLRGRDAGGEARDWQGAFAEVPSDARREFARALRRALGPVAGSLERRTRALDCETAVTGVLPSASDRLRPARTRLGLPPTLWQERRPQPGRARLPIASAHVYVDVSGSMRELLPHLAALLLPYLASRQARVFQFSTEVVPLTLAALRAGALRTTGGTGIDCVLEHALASRRLTRALVLTDGYTGTPRADLAERIRVRGLRLSVVLPAESVWKDDLAGIATSLTTLPALDRARRR